MNDFFIEIAGLNIKISANYPLSHKMCTDFISKSVPDPDITVSVSMETVYSELEKAEDIASPEYAEFLCIYRAIAERLPLFGCFVFHGAAISYDGDGYLFTAPSGTGKSTHIRLWRTYLGKDVDIINGDKPIIKITNGGISVCSTPWAGKENWRKNRIFPLKSIIFLSRSVTPFITPVTPQDSLKSIINQIYMPKNPEALTKTLELMDLLLLKTSLYNLGCDISESSVEVAFEGLTGKSFKEHKI